MFYNKREYSKEKERIVNVTTYNNGTRCAQAKLFHPHNRMREKTIMELDELATSDSIPVRHTNSWKFEWPVARACSTASCRI